MVGQACEKTGWRIHAWVLLSDNYHLLTETPEANLMAWMKWLQATSAQRYNSEWKRIRRGFDGSNHSTGRLSPPNRSRSGVGFFSEDYIRASAKVDLPRRSPARSRGPLVHLPSAMFRPLSVRRRSRPFAVKIQVNPP
jgi:hypothetical protein